MDLNLYTRGIEKFYWYPYNKTLCLGLYGWTGTFHIPEELILNNALSDKIYTGIEPGRQPDEMMKFIGFGHRPEWDTYKHALIYARMIYKNFNLAEKQNNFWYDPEKFSKNIPAPKKEPEKVIPPIRRTRAWGLFVRFSL